MSNENSLDALGTWEQTKKGPTLKCRHKVIAVLTMLFITFAANQNIQADEVDLLAAKQESVTKRYEQLEELLLRLAEVEATENPERSALLRRAAKQSREKFVLEKLKLASASLKTQEFRKAVENQETATKELGNLLKLLLSEDRSKRIRDEKIATPN